MLLGSLLLELLLLLLRLRLGLELVVLARLVLVVVDLLQPLVGIWLGVRILVEFLRVLVLRMPELRIRIRLWRSRL